ncbi:MAG: hypothetical protein VX205_16020, partial [Pseudomonadota bacterium]|nr:hypothetical protein [Pseudomonadota bacterium]
PLGMPSTAAEPFSVLRGDRNTSKMVAAFGTSGKRFERRSWAQNSYSVSAACMFALQSLRFVEHSILEANQRL